ncbi:contact-dependent growth inhibition system immunity protein [Morganella morganii]|uniref:contact-dependent growth inhibition system immunity protein n=1 Tax=Morganella morganii TaxID=582 RepID=UPI003CD0DF80
MIKNIILFRINILIFFESCLLSKDTTAEMLGLCLKKCLKQSRKVDPGNYDFFD